MWNILICDDEQEVLESIKFQLKIQGNGQIELLKGFGSTEELLFYLEEHSRQPYIIILDIRFSGNEEGISVARQVKAYSPDTQIIFISGYREYFEAVYEAEHVYFLLKPFSSEKLWNAITTAGERMEVESKSNLALVKKDGIVKIPFHNILYIESKNRNVYIYTDDITENVYQKLDEILEQVDDRFIRCHKSYSVNLHKIKCLEPDSFTLINEVTVPVSRAFYKEAKQRFYEFLMQG